MQGIALGRCRKTDGMIFYPPHSKELYVSSDYKIDEGRHTPTAFNLHYDGGIFVGQYSHNTSSSCEPYPEGTIVSYPTRINPSSNTTTMMRGIVISVPITSSLHGLPPSDRDASPYIIKLVDGSIHQVSPDAMDDFVNTTLPSTKKIRFPSWLGNHQKVIYLHNGRYTKGLMEWCLDNNTWHLVIDGRMGRRFLELLYLTFVLTSKNISMMEVLSQDGTLARPSLSLVLHIMFL